AAALEAAGPFHGRNVLVFGAGMLGLTACAMARTGGGAAVVCCDGRAGRLERGAAVRATRFAPASQVGSTPAGATEGYGPDAVVEVSGSSEAFAKGLSLVRTGGTVVLVGAVFPGRPVPVAPEDVVRRNLTLRGVHNYAPQHLQTAVRFLEQTS